MHKIYHQVSVIGVGLIGGSFALALKELGIAQHVMGIGRNEQNLQHAVALNVIDSYTTDVAYGVSGSDLVFIATPLASFKTIFAQMSGHLKPDVLITDGGSAKSPLITWAQAALSAQEFQRFVPAHPIAGREHSGVDAALPNLYAGQRVILTPVAQTDAQAIEDCTQLWQALSCKVESMAADYHDNVLAATSHLPHLLAFTLVDLLHEHPELGNVFKYTAGGFRDFTRIASSDPVMWRDIALCNDEAIIRWLTHYQQAIGELIQAVQSANGAHLQAKFLEAKQARDTHLS